MDGLRLAVAADEDLDTVAGMTKDLRTESGMGEARTEVELRSRLSELRDAGYVVELVYLQDEHGFEDLIGFTVYRINPRYVHLRNLFVTAPPTPTAHEDLYRGVFDHLVLTRWSNIAHIRVDVPERPRDPIPANESFWESLGFRRYSIRMQLDTSTKSKVRKSCGAIIVRRGLFRRYYLVIRHVNGGHWGFPKGHVDGDESEMETARREVLEETGIEIDLVDGFYERTYYVTPRGRKKEVVYFLSKHTGRQVITQESEISAYRWVTYHEAMGLLTYRNSKVVLRRALAFLKTNNSRKSRFGGTEPQSPSVL